MNVPTRFRHVILAAGLALAALAPAVLAGPARAAEPLTITQMEVRAAGTYAVVAFTSSEPALVSAEFKPTTAAATAGLAAPTADIVAGGIVGPILPAQAHELKLTGLSSNTTYTVTVSARTADNRAATAQTSFTTAKKRIRVVLESIDIKDDGDGIFTGDGEPLWSVYLAWASGANAAPEYAYCFPLLCKHGSYGEGRFTPLNSEGRALMFVFEEEHFDRFPDRIMLGAAAHESDTRFVDDWAVRLWDCVFSVFKGGCINGEETLAEWRVPQGVESATQTVAVHGDDTVTGFDSVLTFRVELVHNDAPYPPHGRNGPYSNWK